MLLIAMPNSKNLLLVMLFKHQYNSLSVWARLNLGHQALSGNCNAQKTIKGKGSLTVDSKQICKENFHDKPCELALNIAAAYHVHRVSHLTFGPS